MFRLDVISHVSCEDGAALACPENGFQYALRHSIHKFTLLNGSFVVESGPTVFFMTVTMLITFGSAFFTDVIGVHAIFGRFIFTRSPCRSLIP
jgi:hypothetical protein